MKVQRNYLYSSILLLILIVGLKIFSSDREFYNVFEWFIQLLTMPLIFCILAAISKSTVKSTKLLFAGFCGALFTILISRNQEYTIMIYQVIAITIGAIGTWGILEYNKRKKAT